MVAFSTISSAAWARQAISFIANSINRSYGTDEYQRLVLSWVVSEPNCQASTMAHQESSSSPAPPDRCYLALLRVPALKMLAQPDDVFISVQAERVEAGATLHRLKAGPAFTEPDQ